MLDGPFDTVVVVTGAAGLDPEAVRAVAGADRIVAADGGLDHAARRRARPRRARRRPRLRERRRTALGGGEHPGRASPRRQVGDRHRAGLATRRGDAADTGRARRRPWRPPRPRHRRRRGAGCAGAGRRARRRGVVGRRPAADRSPRTLRARRPPRRDDVLRVGAARAVPRRHRERIALAAHGCRPRVDGRSRRVQRGRRPAGSYRRRRRRRHRDRPCPGAQP